MSAEPLQTLLVERLVACSDVTWTAPKMTAGYRLPWVGEPALTLRLLGVPISQGSKKAVGTTKQGRTVLVESSKRLPSWRKSARAQCLAQLPDGWTPLEGPLVVAFHFAMPAPQKIPAVRRNLPMAYPDTSKLIRAVEDSLSVPRGGDDRGAYLDDAQIVDMLAQERYVGHGAELNEPGVIVWLWSHPGLT